MDTSLDIINSHPITTKFVPILVSILCSPVLLQTLPWQKFKLVLGGEATTSLLRLANSKIASSASELPLFRTSSSATGANMYCRLVLGLGSYEAPFGLLAESQSIDKRQARNCDQ